MLGLFAGHESFKRTALHVILSAGLEARLYVSEGWPTLQAKPVCVR